MKNTKRKYFIAALLTTIFLSACSNQNVKNTNGSSSTGGGTQAGGGTQTGTINGSGASNVNSTSSTSNYLPKSGANNDPNNTQDLTLAGLSDPNNLLSRRVIYFDYNQASIRTEYMILINAHAQLATKFPQLKMRLEGHADERGSREYNVALSEARAQSVKRIMGTQGARSGQIKTIGYGEEVPIVTGHNKRSWQKNRRVEIKYENY